MGIFKKRKEVNRIYHLAGNDWYMVAEDEDKMMLVDTDCKISNDASKIDEIKMRWSYDSNTKGSESGRKLLECTNDIANEHFADIKYAIIPRTVTAGTCTLDDALMWPMSKEEFNNHKCISGKIVKNTGGAVWTRTFSSIVDNNRYAWCLGSITGNISEKNNNYVDFFLHVAPAFYLRKSAIDHITEDGEIVLIPQTSDCKFMFDENKVYHLADNDWYAVMQDNYRVMLVDTDSKIGTEMLRTPWSDEPEYDEKGESGQCILNYCNNLADTYFSGIKYAIEPRTVTAGSGRIEDAWIWPMSKEEFERNQKNNCSIIFDSKGGVWTRTFGYFVCNGEFCCIYNAYTLGRNGNGFSCSNVDDTFNVAPAFYLRKSAIDHITDDGEIVLKPAEPVEDENDCAIFDLAEEFRKLSTETEKLDKMLEESAAKRKEEKETEDSSSFLNFFNSDLDFFNVKEESLCGKLILAIASMDESERELFEKTLDMFIHKINMNNFNFVTGTTRTYRLAGNDWYAVSQDDETVLLVDTDAALPRANGILVGLEHKWSNGDWGSTDGENGQALLDYTNKLVDKYFSEIKYAMKPISIACDYKECMYFSEPKNLKGNINEAYMFPLNCDEFSNCSDIAGKIYQNSIENRDNLKNENEGNLFNSNVWTRTFSGIYSNSNRYARCLYNTSGGLSNYGNVGNPFRVAPAFNLKKSCIIRINPDGEIILEPEEKDMSQNTNAIPVTEK